jgi:hypothetical protein
VTEEEKLLLMKIHEKRTLFLEECFVSDGLMKTMTSAIAIAFEPLHAEEAA